MSYFEPIISQFPALWEALGNARKNGRLGHAFLISSDLQDTRERFALALSALSCCPSAVTTGLPCGECTSCRQLSSENYPELYHLSPVGKGYQIQIGDRQNPEQNTVRHFGENFFLTSTSSAEKKLGIIHEADRMNSESQNALLKTLEEPPRGTMIMLTTGNPSALLPTTKSRCQHLQLLENAVCFDFAGAKELFASLERLFFAGRGNMVVASQEASSIIAISQSLKSNSAAIVEAEWEERIASAAEYDPQYAKRLKERQEDAASGAYMRLRKDFLSAIHSYASQLYILASGGTIENLANPEIMGEGVKGRIDFDHAEKFLKEADELLYNLRFNVNEELALRNFAVQSAF